MGQVEAPTLRTWRPWAGVAVAALVVSALSLDWVPGPCSRASRSSSRVYYSKVVNGHPTRLLIDDSTWARASEKALREWRATLFGRMAQEYSKLEKRESEGGAKQIGRVEPQGHPRFDLFSPFIKCRSGNVSRVGSDGEGGKLVCMDEYMQAEGCIIYSLGSNGQFDFEEGVLESTRCEVHTFDCTYDGKDLPNPRHHYHKICVGLPGGGASPTNSPQAAAEDFMKYEDIVAMLGHSRVDLLKIDIEGFEFDVFAGFQPSCELPLQIAMEVHFSSLYNTDGQATNFDNLFWSLHDVSLGELAVFFAHFADMGYGVVSREDNLPWGVNCCSEFTLVRVEKLAGC